MTGSQAGAGGSDSALHLRAWQSKLLPLMAGLLAFLTVFFVIATLVQAWRMQQQIEQGGGPKASVADAMELDSGRGLTLERARWEANVRLEQYIIDRRYQQASLILMGRAWITFLGFTTGMILALVGAGFILGKLREPVTELGAEGSVLKVSIASASPGLILATLGTALMTATMIVRAEVSVTDTPLYVVPTAQVTAPSEPEVRMPPPADVPDPGDERRLKSTDDSVLDELDREAEILSGRDNR